MTDKSELTDEEKIEAAAKKFADYYGGPYEYSSVDRLDAKDIFTCGARWAMENPSPAVEGLVKALERECCCTGELDWQTHKPVLCDACDALREYRGMGNDTRT